MVSAFPLSSNLLIPNVLMSCRSPLLSQALLWLAAATPTSSPVNAITSSHSLTVEVIRINILHWNAELFVSVMGVHWQLAQMHMNAIIHIRT